MEPARDGTGPRRAPAIQDHRDPEHAAQDRPLRARGGEEEEHPPEPREDSTLAFAQVEKQGAQEHGGVEGDLHPGHVPPEKMRAPEEEQEGEQHPQGPREHVAESSHELSAQPQRRRAQRERPGNRGVWAEAKEVRRGEQEGPEEARGARRGRVPRGVDEGMALGDGPRVLEVNEAVVERKGDLPSGRHPLHVEDAKHLKGAVEEGEEAEKGAGVLADEAGEPHQRTRERTGGCVPILLARAVRPDVTCGARDAGKTSRACAQPSKRARPGSTRRVLRPSCGTKRRRTSRRRVSAAQRWPLVRDATRDAACMAKRVGPEAHA